MTPITFADHEAFHRTALRLVAGGAAGGVASLALSALPLPFDVSAALPALVAGGAGLGAAFGRGHGRRMALVGGGLALALLSPLLFPHHPVFGLLVAGALAGAVLHRLRLVTAEEGTRPGRLGLAFAMGAGALASALGQRAVLAYASRGLLEAYVPDPLAAAGYGALGGLFLAVAAAGAHLSPDPDPVEAAWARLQARLSGEVRSLVLRAMEGHRQALSALGAAEGPARVELRRQLTEVTQRILDLASRWAQVEQDLGAASESELGKRLEEVRGLAEAATDESAKRQYAIAQKTLEEELGQIARIRQGRERVVARLHGQMALLERTRFALVGMRSADAHRAGAQLASLSEGLSAIARELDTESEAIGEAHAQA